MKLLTVEDAPKLLEPGEVYRLGYNHVNSGEMFFCFDRIDKCPHSIADFERIELEHENSPEEDHNQLNLSVIKQSLTCDRLFGYWGFTMEELEDCVAAGDDHYRAYAYADKYCSGSGAEPMWILEHGESCDDIPFLPYE
tara:strand:- start:48 stop:464 length:417 start_codon:yes stop_codon:yes gene_type:complete